MTMPVMDVLTILIFKMESDKNGIGDIGLQL